MPSADSPASAPSEAAESAEQVPTQGRLDLEETGAQSTDEDDGGREAGKPEERPRDDAREIDETAAPSRRSLRYRWKPVLPDRAREDDPRAWGERSEDDDDRFLTNRPPHWG